MQVEKGNTIKVEYTGSFKDGEVFDSSEEHGQPLEFEAGAGEVVDGFDEAVIGMKVDEEKTVTITPDKAYGMPTDEAIQQVPKNVIPFEIEEGMEIEVPLEDNESIPGLITKIEGDMITIDMNHPLAGETLVFKIKLVEIK
ncbi:MAG: peptidylprolyl isomerase [Patescibacteria group bacterium]|jgi:peptidylprolyl isomerase